MERNFCFLQGVKVFVLAVQLFQESGESSLSLLFSKQENRPLKVILNRLLEKNVTKDETSTILQLLISYATTPQGAKHLSRNDVLTTIYRANIMQSVNREDLYVAKQLKNSLGEAST